MAKGDRFWRMEAKKDALKKADADGSVADSMEVRMALVKRMEAGEITLEQMQAELAAIKRGAKKAGKITRSQAWARG